MRFLSSSGPTSPAARRRFRTWRVALVVVLALSALCWAFDWNWCRPLIRHYVMSRSQRSVDFDDMQVHFRDGLDPTIELRGLTIQNAPWAATKAPFMHAGRIALTVSWRTLGSDMIVISLIELDDAQVDMERRADGIRNWRITRPDDTGPARVRVLALEARNSRVHLIHGGLGLELDASTTPLAAPEPFEGHPELPLTQKLLFNGRFRDDSFDGFARASDVLRFGDTPRMFSFTAQARSGALQLVASGLTSDAHALGDFDCDVKVSAAGTGDYKPLPAALARLRPLEAQGHVAKAGDRWTGTAVRVRAGRQSTAIVDVTFTGSIKSATPRRTLKATLRDAVIDLDDVLPTRGKAADAHAASGHAPSTQPLPLDRLRALDADVDLRRMRFVGTERGGVQGVRGHATLAAGVLRLQALDVALADGHVTGALQVDASRSPADVAIDLRARGLRVDELSTKLAANGVLDGAVDGRALVKTRGDSARALLADASGSISLSLADGASVSKRLDAKLGLNGGEWLRTLFDKSARVPVQCASMTLTLDHGVATTRHVVFETPDSALAARGSADLVDETVDVTLTPAHKKLALLALDKSIHAQGSWHDVKVALAPASGDAPERCAH